MTSIPAPAEKAKREASSDPYEDVQLRPNPYDDIYDEKDEQPAPPPEAGPAPEDEPLLTARNLISELNPRRSLDNDRIARHSACALGV
jgi:hypothetical protein